MVSRISLSGDFDSLGELQGYGAMDVGRARSGEFANHFAGLANVKNDFFTTLADSSNLHDAAANTKE